MTVFEMTKNWNGVRHRFFLLASKGERIRELETVSRSRSVSLDRLGSLSCETVCRDHWPSSRWITISAGGSGLQSKTPCVSAVYSEHALAGFSQCYLL